MRKAFTLIELLVVISIIALLLSVIVPSLNMAKEVAKRTICATHLKSIGVGVMVYANKNDDALPKGLYQTGQTSVPAAYFMLYLNPGPGDAALLAESPKQRVQDVWGLGHLFMNDIISEGEVFYCPSTPKDVAQDFGYDAYSNGGDNFPYRNFTSTGKENYIRSSYMYVPQAKRKVQITGDSGTGYFHSTAEKTYQLSGNTVMACDVLFRLDRLPHRKGAGGKGSGVNTLCADGSVAFANNADAFSPDLWGDYRDQTSVASDEYLFRTIVSLLK